MVACLGDLLDWEGVQKCSRCIQAEVKNAELGAYTCCLIDTAEASFLLSFLMRQVVRIASIHFTFNGSSHTRHRLGCVRGRMLLDLELSWRCDSWCRLVAADGIERWSPAANSLCTLVESEFGRCFPRSCLTNHAYTAPLVAYTLRPEPAQNKRSTASRPSCLGL